MKTSDKKHNIPDIQEIYTKYNLEIEKMNCAVCGQDLVCDIPVVHKGAIGFKCPPCPNCKHKGTPQNLIITDSELCKTLDSLHKKTLNDNEMPLEHIQSSDYSRKLIH